MALPRSKWMTSKDYASFNRPKVHISLTLVHGFFHLWTISHPNTMKDSNASVETIAYALNILKKDFNIDLRQCKLSIHSDNTAREIKNNFFFKYCALQVSCGNLRSMTVRFLRCGHSHEDCDQCFGRLARFFSRTKVIETPSEFVARTTEFAQKMDRKHEPAYYVVEMQRARDWILVRNFDMWGGLKLEKPLVGGESDFVLIKVIVCQLLRYINNM